MNYLGKHTTIGYLEPKHFSKIPFLKDNGGRLPPFIIAVGDGRRAEAACEVLGLKDKIHLPSAGEKLLGLKGRGRVNIFLGRYERSRKSIPLLIVETQIGMPAVEVILREILSHTATEYCYDIRKMTTDSVYIIRAGTAGGFNVRKGKRVRCGEITNATFSLGWSGTAIQSLAGLEFNPDTIKSFKRAWLRLGLKFTRDGRYPLAPSNNKVVMSITEAARSAKIPCHRGGNFSKDSLYAETNDHLFLELYERYGVISTEMEQVGVARLAAEMTGMGVPVCTGLVSGIVGILPEFSNDPKVHELAEKRALTTAAEALRLLSLNGSR